MISSNPQQIGLPSLKNQHVANPLDTGRTLNVPEAFFSQEEYLVKRT